MTGQTLFYVTFVDECNILMIDEYLKTSLQNIKGRIMDVSLESAFIGVCTGVGWGACLEICEQTKCSPRLEDSLVSHSKLGFSWLCFTFLMNYSLLCCSKLNVADNLNLKRPTAAMFYKELACGN